MEYPVVKVAFSELSGIDYEKINPAIYEISWDGILLEFFVNVKKELKKAVVFGTGDIDRTKKSIPEFQRISWTNRIAATTIYYSDPTLHLTDTDGLMWCYGRRDDWYIERIAIVLLKILDTLSIDISATLFYGSSGGGFTSICLATLLGGRATVINPQLILTHF